MNRRNDGNTEGRTPTKRRRNIKLERWGDHRGAAVNIPWLCEQRGWQERLGVPASDKTALEYQI